MKLVEAALQEDPSIPVVVHLDHGPSFEMCRDCIDGGFTSVMIDENLTCPYEENIAITKQVVDYAHPRRGWKPSWASWPALKEARFFGRARLHRPGRGRGLCAPHGPRLPGRSHRHQPRLQIQGRKPGWTLSAYRPSTISWRLPWCCGNWRAAGVCGPLYRRRPGGGAKGRAERYAAQGCGHGRVQDQRGYGYPSGPHRLHPSVSYGAPGAVRSQRLPQAGPRRTWWPTKSATSWGRPARPRARGVCPGQGLFGQTRYITTSSRIKGAPCPSNWD